MYRSSTNPLLELLVYYYFLYSCYYLDSLRKGRRVPEVRLSRRWPGDAVVAERRSLISFLLFLRSFLAAASQNAKEGEGKKRRKSLDLICSEWARFPFRSFFAFPVRWARGCRRELHRRNGEGGKGKGTIGGRARLGMCVFWVLVRGARWRAELETKRRKKENVLPCRYLCRSSASTGLLGP